MVLMVSGASGLAMDRLPNGNGGSPHSIPRTNTTRTSIGLWKTHSKEQEEETIINPIDHRNATRHLVLLASE